MTKEQAVQAFWEQFGWPVYDASTVPDNAQFPYMTYSVKTDSFDNTVFDSVSLWDKSYSWVDITQQANTIAQTIKEMTPPTIKIDGGRLYITMGKPYSQRVTEQNDVIRHILLNINYEFLTDY